MADVGGARGTHRTRRSDRSPIAPRPLRATLLRVGVLHRVHVLPHHSRTLKSNALEIRTQVTQI